MFFLALATDYDGTLALHGRVDEPTIEALRSLRSSGRKLILVTGRTSDELAQVFDQPELFDLIVAENGASLLDPSRQEEIFLSPPPPAKLVDRLRGLGVRPLTVGRTIISTWEPNEGVVLQAIRDLQLEHHIIFNKGAVMVLPSGVNKASGLDAALRHLGLSSHNVVGVGDAENDQAFLGACGCAVAVSNALPTVKEKADLVVGDHGQGIIALAEMLIADDLASARPSVPRRRPVVGHRAGGGKYSLDPFAAVLICGGSGGGKSTIVTALLEQMQDLGYQFCVIDPEGDYDELPDAVTVGNAKEAPRIREAVDLLAKPDISTVVNLLAISVEERPRFIAEFLPELNRLRTETGRPHWIVLDEIHHCLPANWQPAPLTLPREMPAVIGVTVHPEAVAPDFLALVSTVVGVGEKAREVIEAFCKARGNIAPASMKIPQRGELLLLDGGGTAELIRAVPSRGNLRRHARKYAEGELGEDKSFYFKGPRGALNLRAQNLAMFLQMAAGVDDETWLFHLREGAYSRWFRCEIKDDELAADAQIIENEDSLSADESRKRIKEIVDKRYTAPAKTG